MKPFFHKFIYERINNSLVLFVYVIDGPKKTYHLLALGAKYSVFYLIIMVTWNDIQLSFMYYKQVSCCKVSKGSWKTTKKSIISILITTYSAIAHHKKEKIHLQRNPLQCVSSHLYLNTIMAIIKKEIIKKHLTIGLHVWIIHS